MKTLKGAECVNSINWGLNLGSTSPQTDVEVMLMAVELFEKLGLQNLKLVINSLGDVDSRKLYHKLW